MKKYTILFSLTLIVGIFLTLFYSCEEDEVIEEENNIPTCSITFPLQNAEMMKGEIITITAQADDIDGDLIEIIFYIDDVKVGTSNSEPYTYEWNTSNASVGNHSIKAEAIDEKNAKAESSISVSIIDSQLKADFVANKLIIILGDTLNFTDQTIGIPSSWTWNFGDDENSIEQNPKYVYLSAGIYNVSLEVSNDFNSDTETKTDYIKVQTTPTISTTTISTLIARTAIVGGNILDDGYSDVSERGVYYGTDTIPENNGVKFQIGSGVGLFSDTIRDLSINTKYYVRAYATNSIGTVYGNRQSFTTNDGVPTFTTMDITNVTAESATSGGIITDDGGYTITWRGVCWNTTPISTFDDADTQASQNGEGTGSYTVNMTTLKPNTTYYVRAFAANNEAGLFLGDEKSFTTKDGIPEVITLDISDITIESAISGGNVTKDGGFPIIARGICWNDYNTFPNILENHTTDGSGTGDYASNITGLNANTTYYVRAYAKNSNSSGSSGYTVYGEVKSFTTDDGLPNGLTTTEISNITATTATSGGNIADDGGFAITFRGVCWSTTNNPTISDSHTTDGSGAGSFTSSITGLSEWTTYYIRSYATNETGTTYGQQLTFTANNPITDYDDNSYQTIKIGNQIWMAENLKTTHYANGTEITLVENNTAWEALSYTDEAYCYYDNSVSNKDVYGSLYTWSAAMDGASSSAANPSGVQGACPDGWHLPSDNEWKVLEMELGMSASEADAFGYRGTDEGDKLKAAYGWDNDGNGTNSSGFNALPSGQRDHYNGAFGIIGTYTEFWSSTTGGASSVAYTRTLSSSHSTVIKNNVNMYKDRGLPVRCIKD